ncbi:hypothetical protein BSNK01_10160 [Bacillaceae bacterium]
MATFLRGTVGLCCSVTLFAFPLKKLPLATSLKLWYVIIVVAKNVKHIARKNKNKNEKKQ